MHAANRVFSRLHTLFSYNFLGNGPIKTIFEMYIDIGSQNKIPFTFSRNIGELNFRCEKISRICMTNST